MLCWGLVMKNANKKRRCSVLKMITSVPLSWLRSHVRCWGLEEERQQKENLEDYYLGSKKNC